VEAKRGAKEWLDYQMRPQSTYKERAQKAKFSQLIDIELAYDNSRSFQRLYDAVAELLEAAEKGERGVVTPLSAPPQEVTVLLLAVVLACNNTLMQRASAKIPSLLPP
jgi:hypothetical protein